MIFSSMHQLLLLLAPVLFPVIQQPRQSVPLIIEGKVLHAGTHQPVKDAYVHVLAGEEETVTGKDGSFTIKTWQRLPVECTIEHKDFSLKKITLRNKEDTLVVYLNRK